jgi:hypothetical protein
MKQELCQNFAGIPNHEKPRENMASGLCESEESPWGKWFWDIK